MAGAGGVGGVVGLAGLASFRTDLAGLAGLAGLVLEAVSNLTRKETTSSRGMSSLSGSARSFSLSVSEDIPLINWSRMAIAL